MFCFDDVCYADIYNGRVLGIFQEMIIMLTTSVSSSSVSEGAIEDLKQQKINRSTGCKE